MFSVVGNRVFEYTAKTVIEHKYEPKYLDQIWPVQTFIPELPTEISELIIDFFLAQLLTLREFDLVAEIIHGNASLTKRFYRLYISSNNPDVNLCSTRIFSVLAICTAIERNYQQLVFLPRLSIHQNGPLYSLDLEPGNNRDFAPWTFTDPPYFERFDSYENPFVVCCLGNHYLDTIALIGKYEGKFIMAKETSTESALAGLEGLIPSDKIAALKTSVAKPASTPATPVAAPATPTPAATINPIVITTPLGTQTYGGIPTEQVELKTFQDVQIPFYGSGCR